MKLKTTTLMVILAGFIEMGTTLNAAVVYEGFQYAAGTNLNGLNGGTGFSAGWVAASSPPHAITSTGLSVPGLDTSGRAVSGGLANDPLVRSLSTTFAGTSGTTTWVSYLLHVTSLDSASYATMFLTNSGFNVTFGKFGAFEDGLGGTYFGLGTNRGGDTLLSTMAVSADTTYLIVGSTTWSASGNETMSLYIDPTPGTTPPTPTFTSTAYNLKAGVKGIDMRMRDYTTGWTLDEIRLGDSYAEVAPVPEPGTSMLLLSALGAWGALGLTSRRP